MNENPNYFAILTADVRYSDKINANEKLLFAEITALSSSTGICWASNNYFANLYNCTPQAVSKWIKNLKLNGFISINYIYKKGTSEIEKRQISCVNIGLGGINTGLKGINNGLGGYQHTIKDNNTSINNKLNNSIVVSEQSSSKPPEIEKPKTIELFPNETRVNNNYDYGEEIPKKFAQKKVTDSDKAKKTLFRNSDVYKLVKFDENNNGDYSEYEKLFKGEEFDPIDLVYYFHSVSDWSDQSDTKRTKAGWIATVRKFIRGDAEKNKIKLKPEFQQNHQKSDSEDMLKFLNNNY